MHYRLLNGMLALVGSVALLPCSDLSATEPVPQPVTQEADFWLWFSDYGDSDGMVFDPEDLEQLTKSDKKIMPNALPETGQQSDAHARSKVGSMQGEPRINAGEEAL